MDDRASDPTSSLKSDEKRLEEALQRKLDKAERKKRRLAAGQLDSLRPESHDRASVEEGLEAGVAGNVDARRRVAPEAGKLGPKRQEEPEEVVLKGSTLAQATEVSDFRTNRCQRSSQRLQQLRPASSLAPSARS